VVAVGGCGAVEEWNAGAEHAAVPFPGVAGGRTESRRAVIEGPDVDFRVCCRECEW
jgi:hypothetical protein